MIVTILGDRRSTLAPDWTTETVVAFLGDANVDASRGAGPGAVLTFVGIGGDLRLHVPPGSRIAEGGSTILGDWSIDVTPGDGPEIRVNAYGLFGDVKITD